MSTRLCDCGRQTTGSAVLCRACNLDLRAHLAALIALVPELEVALSRQARVAAPSPTTGAALGKRDGQPLPYDVGASDVLAGLHAFALSWLADLAPAQRPSAQTPAAALQALLSAERASPGYARADGLLWELRRAHSAVLEVIDHPVHLVWLGPCGAEFVVEGIVVGECTGTVRAPAGDARAQCRTCGALYNGLERRRWLLESASASTLNTSQLGRQLAAYGIGKTARGVVRAVQRLVADERLAPAGQDEHGAPTYRIGDVLDALATRRTYRRTA